MPKIPAGFAFTDVNETLLLFVEDKYICNVCGESFEEEDDAHNHMVCEHPIQRVTSARPKKYLQLNP